MRSLLLCVLVAACPVAMQNSAAQVLSQGERDYAVSALHASRKYFLDTVAGLSEAQMKWKASPESWSVAEVGEHIALGEAMFPQMVQKSLKEPATPEKKQADPRKMDYQLMKTVPVRDQKFQAPETLKPLGKFPTKAALVEAFRSQRDINIAYIRETPDDLRVHFIKHPVFGELDGLQWYILMAAHTDRHVNQMREVIANPNFPKR
jgi:hypothetical protein